MIFLKKKKLIKNKIYIFNLIKILIYIFKVIKNNKKNYKINQNKYLYFLKTYTLINLI